MKLNRLNKLKVEQLLIENTFDGQESDSEYNYVLEYFNGDVDEANDLIKWRKEDKIFFTKELKELLKLVENSKTED